MYLLKPVKILQVLLLFKNIYLFIFALSRAAYGVIQVQVACLLLVAEILGLLLCNACQQLLLAIKQL